MHAMTGITKLAWLVRCPTCLADRGEPCRGFLDLGRAGAHEERITVLAADPAPVLALVSDDTPNAGARRQALLALHVQFAKAHGLHLEVEAAHGRRRGGQQA